MNNFMSRYVKDMSFYARMRYVMYSVPSHQTVLILASFISIEQLMNCYIASYLIFINNPGR